MATYPHQRGIVPGLKHWRSEGMADRARPQTLEVAHPNAAGIDIGSGEPLCAVRADVDETPVREFLSFTEDLEAAGAVVDAVWCGCGGDGIDRRVLDPAV